MQITEYFCFSPFKFMIFPFLFLVGVSQNAFAQEEEENINYEEQIFLDNIKSIKLFPNSLPLAPPIIPLGGNSRLLLSFDDLDKDAKNYVYSVVHCNADWTPSDIEEMDYLDGFPEGDIEEYNFSFNTLMPYTHYELVLPNEDVRWTISGNYLLKVYEDEEEKKLAFTRRFMVVDASMTVSAKLTPTAMVSNRETHHEFDFEVNHKDIRISNPDKEIQVVIRQNYRWDNAIFDLKPVFVRDERIVYNHQNKLLFPAGKEFRFLDLRSFRYVRQGILEIFEGDEFYEVAIVPDELRAYTPYSSNVDLNGNYIIESLDNDNPDLRGDYAEVLFSLRSNTEYHDADVYVVGAFTDWQLQEEFRMSFNPTLPGYLTKGLLKEGFYDYAYAYVPVKNPSIDLSELEGDAYQTINQYSILVYFRPFGQRYDRLVAVHNFDSRF
jgi:hypothetical protein